MVRLMRSKNQNTGQKLFIVDFMNWNTFLDAIEQIHSDIYCGMVMLFEAPLDVRICEVDKLSFKFLLLLLV